MYADNRCHNAFELVQIILKGVEKWITSDPGLRMPQYEIPYHLLNADVTEFGANNLQHAWWYNIGDFRKDVWGH